MSLKKVGDYLSRFLKTTAKTGKVPVASTLKKAISKEKMSRKEFLQRSKVITDEVKVQADYFNTLNKMESKVREARFKLARLSKEERKLLDVRKRAEAISKRAVKEKKRRFAEKLNNDSELLGEELYRKAEEYAFEDYTGDPSLFLDLTGQSYIDNVFMELSSFPKKEQVKLLISESHSFPTMATKKISEAVGKKVFDSSEQYQKIKKKISNLKNTIHSNGLGDINSELSDEYFKTRKAYQEISGKGHSEVVKMVTKSDDAMIKKPKGLMDYLINEFKEGYYGE